MDRIHDVSQEDGSSSGMACIFQAAENVQVGNALEELQGKELKAATDAACSRILEALISHAAPDAFLGLMNALTDGEEWCKLSARWTTDLVTHV